MRKYFFILVVLFYVSFIFAELDYTRLETLDLASSDVDLNQIEWNSAFTQAMIPPERLHELTTIIPSQITEVQWRCCNNIELATDLHEARAAWQVLLETHPNIKGLDLALGSTTYTEGKLVNGGVELDLKESGFEQMRVVARAEGGFELYSEKSFSLTGSSFVTPVGRSVLVVAKERFILGEGVEFKDAQGNSFLSLGDGTTITTSSNGVEITGFALLHDRFGNEGMIGNKQEQGRAHLSYGEDGRYELEEGIVAVHDGLLQVKEIDMQGGTVLYDEEFGENVEIAVVRALERSAQKVDPSCVSDCQFRLQNFKYEVFQQIVLTELGILPTKIRSLMGTGSEGLSTEDEKMNVKNRDVEGEVPIVVSQAVGDGAEGGLESLQEDFSFQQAADAAGAAAFRSLVEHTMKVEFGDNDVRVIAGVSDGLRTYVTGKVGIDGRGGSLRIDQKGDGADVAVQVRGLAAGLHASSEGAVREPWVRVARGDQTIVVSVANVDEGDTQPKMTVSQVLGKIPGEGSVVAEGTFSTDVAAGSKGLAEMGGNMQAFATLKVSN